VCHTFASCFVVPSIDQLNCFCWCKSIVARWLGLCSELLSVTCVSSCLLSKGLGCLQQLDSWFKHVLYWLSCLRMNLPRSEVFVKVNMIDQQYMNRHRLIKFGYCSKRNSNSLILRYSQWCTIFLASLELFYLFLMWLTSEFILMLVF